MKSLSAFTETYSYLDFEDKDFFKILYEGFIRLNNLLDIHVFINLIKITIKVKSLVV